MKQLLIAILALVLAGFLYFSFREQSPAPEVVAVTSFEECQAAGYPIMESYPARCMTPEGLSFTEDIGNELEKQDLIMIESPRPNTAISSPLTITGHARGYWFFEASFPITLLAEDGSVLAQSFATAEGEWMTEEFVPFTATLQFVKPINGKGTLILHKDNPSGDPIRDDSLHIPVSFE